MGKINWGRVFLGGLLAGVVVNVFEYVTNGVVLAGQWDAAQRALGHAMPPSAVPVFIVWGFLVGIAAIWLYAAIRPRFGPGPKTAASSGFGFWIIGYVFPNLSLAALQQYPLRLLVITTLVGLVEIVAGSLVGGWVYKE